MEIKPEAKELKAEPSAPDSPEVGRTLGGGMSPHPPRFSKELERLIGAFAERTVCVGEVLGVLHNRGYTVLLILLSFPFCTPLPLPGVSMPFGLVIAFIGLRLALGQKAWLPARLLATRLPPKFFTQMLVATRHLVCWLEWMLKPRFARLFGWRLAGRGMGTMILVCGLLMALPLPIPFSNGLPAMTVLLLASANLEEDGWAAMAGGVSFVLTLAFFAAMFWGGTEIAGWLQDRFEILREGNVDQ
jgi:hypothetical protein